MSCPWCGGAASEVIRGDLLRCSTVSENGEQCGYQYRPRAESQQPRPPSRPFSPSNIGELQAAAVARKNEASRLEGERLEEERKYKEYERPYREAARRRAEALNGWAKKISIRLVETRFPKDHALYYSVTERYRSAWGKQEFRNKKTVYCMGWTIAEEKYCESVYGSGDTMSGRVGRRGILLTTLGNFVNFRMEGEGYELLTYDNIVDCAGKVYLEEVFRTVKSAEELNDPGSFFVLGNPGWRFWMPMLRLEESVGKLAERANLL